MSTNIFEQFCDNLADFDNWDFGYLPALDTYAHFYINDPDFRVVKAKDESRGDNGYVESFDLAILGFNEELTHKDFGDTLNATFYEIEFYYKDIRINDAVGCTLDNSKVTVAFPNCVDSTGKWYYTAVKDKEGLNYYVSLMLGNGCISRNRNNQPLNVEVR